MTNTKLPFCGHDSNVESERLFITVNLSFEPSELHHGLVHSRTEELNPMKENEVSIDSLKNYPNIRRDSGSEIHLSCSEQTLIQKQSLKMDISVYFSKRVPKISSEERASWSLLQWSFPVCLKRKNRKLSLGTWETLKFTVTNPSFKSWLFSRRSISVHEFSVPSFETSITQDLGWQPPGPLSCDFTE